MALLPAVVVAPQAVAADEEVAVPRVVAAAANKVEGPIFSNTGSRMTLSRLSSMIRNSHLSAPSKT